MLTVKQFAKRRRISIPRVHQLLQQGRIAGATRLGPLWVIPEGAAIDPPLKAKHRRKKRKETRHGRSS